jgi:hypothetical protein
VFVNSGACLDLIGLMLVVLADVGIAPLK